MEDEKELIRKIRNSLKAGKSRAEVVSSLQGKGCNLAYSEALISKAKRSGKLLRNAILFSVVILALVIAFLAIIAPSSSTLSSENAVEIRNPLEGLKVLFQKEETANENSSTENSTQLTNESEIYIEDIEITPEFIAYLLSAIGAQESLHKNPLTRENPLINFKIDEILYQSEIAEEILVDAGLNPEADIQFNSTKEIIVQATLSETPDQVFKDSVIAGTTTIDKIAGDADLFAKGYLDLYEQFK